MAIESGNNHNPQDHPGVAGPQGESLRADEGHRGIGIPDTRGVPTSELLRPETHGEILNFFTRFTTQPGARKYSLDAHNTYSEAIEAGEVDPKVVDTRATLIEQPRPEDTYTSFIELTTYGESHKSSNPNPDGSRNIAYAAIIIGPDEAHDFGNEHGKLFVDVGVTDQHTVVYSYDLFSHAADPDIDEIVMEEYDKWGLPRQKDQNDVGGVLDEAQGRRFLRALQTYARPQEAE
jgi:hypothetical protein